MNYFECLYFRLIPISICCFHSDFCRVDYSNNGMSMKLHVILFVAKVTSNSYYIGSGAIFYCTTPYYDN